MGAELFNVDGQANGWLAKSSGCGQNSGPGNYSLLRILLNFSGKMQPEVVQNECVTATGLPLGTKLPCTLG
jgi:hypothetical protein